MAEWTKWEVERAIVSGLAFGFSIAFSSIIVLLFFFDLFSRFSVDALPRFSPSSHPHIPFAYSPLFLFPFLHHSVLVLSCRTPHVHAYAHSPLFVEVDGVGCHFHPRLSHSYTSVLSHASSHPHAHTRIHIPSYAPFRKHAHRYAHSHRYLIPLMYPRSHTDTPPLACTLLHAPL